MFSFAYSLWVRVGTTVPETKALPGFLAHTLPISCKTGVFSAKVLKREKVGSE